MMNADLKSNSADAAAQLERWSRAVVQPLLVTIQVTALLIGFLYVLQGIFEEPWVILWPLYTLFFLETAYSTRWLRQPEQRLLGQTAFRITELIAFGVIFRLGTWWLFGQPTDQETLLEYLKNPLLIFDGRFFGVFLMAFFGWSVVTRLMVYFEHLGVDAAEFSFFTAPRSEREQNARPVSIDRSIIFGDLFRFWAFGGIFMTVMIALNTLQLDKITVRGNLLRSQAAVPLPLLLLALIYLGSGFLMLSQARLSTYSARWLMNGTPPNHSVERVWYRTGLQRLAVILLLASLLPIGSTFPLLRALLFIMRGISTAVGVVLLLFQRLLAFLMSLFPAGTAPPAEPIPPSIPTLFPLPTPPPPPVIPPPNDGVPLISILFWIVMIIIAVESILFFLNTRGFSVPSSLTGRIIAAVQGMWRRWQAEWALRQALLAELAHIETPSVPTIKARPRWSLWRRPLRYDHLPPRLRIRLFFMTLLQMAQGVGLARQAAESPAEYGRRLDNALISEEEPINTLTALFESARYAITDLEEAEAQSAEAAWETLKKALKNYSPNPDS